MTKVLWLIAAACLALVGCSRGTDNGHARDAAPSAHGEGDHGHGHGHGAGISVTHFTDATELFVEFPPLVKGEEAAFAAHLTRLSDFKAIDRGKLVVTLSGGGQPEERGESGVSATAGIFRPVLKPQYAGKRRLTFTLTTPDLTAVHDVGEVEVYPNAKRAEAVAEEKAGDAGIGFTKEQQWTIDFAVVPAQERTVRESLAVTAVIRPRASAEAHVAAPGAGLLRPGSRGFPQVGVRVTADQVLGYLVPRLAGDTDTATLQLAVERARVEVEHTRRERERLEDLLRSEAVPEKRVHEARHRQRIAEAELSAAQQRMGAYQGGSGGIPLKAPIAGTLVGINGAAGAAVTEGQTVFHIADLDKLWLEARVPESDLGRIGTPNGAFFRLDGHDEALVLDTGRNARLIAVGGVVDPHTRTVPVILEFENPRGQLKAGMNLRASLFTGNATGGVAVPASAIVDDNGQPIVFVQTEGESFERRVVTLGTRDGDWVAVQAGLSPGERVVTRGAYQVRLAAAAPAALGHGHAH